MELFSIRIQRTFQLVSTYNIKTAFICKHIGINILFPLALFYYLL